MDAHPPDRTETPKPDPYEPPRSSPDRPRPPSSPLAKLAAVFLVILASLIAFVATCFPVGWGLAASDFGGSRYNFLIPFALACAVGGVVAAITGFLLARMLKRIDQRSRRAD